MASIEVNEPLEIVVDDGYEGLLSSYFESDAWRKMMSHRYHDPGKTRSEFMDDEEKTSTEKHPT